MENSIGFIRILEKCYKIWKKSSKGDFDSSYYIKGIFVPWS